MVTKEELKELGFDNNNQKEGLPNDGWIDLDGTDLYLGGPDACTLGHCFKIPDVDSIDKLKDILKIIL
jgi:hypothetical protein